MRSKALFKWLDRWVGIPLVALAGLFRPRRRAAPLAPGDRVLLIKQSALGDTLLLLPVIRALRAAVGPAGRVDMVCTGVNAAALQGNADLDSVLKLDPGALLRRPWRALAFVRGLRRARYEWVLDFDQWLRSSALLAAASGAGGRAGFATPGQHKHAAFTDSAPNHRDGHEFEQFKDVAAMAGLDRGAVPPFAGFLLAAGYLGAAPVAPQSPPWVLLHPGTGGARGWQREWPVERFAELGRALRQSHGARLILSGAGAYEAGLCDAIDAGLDAPAEERCVDNGLRGLVAALCKADLVVCGNTGVMHLAAGLGRPLVALHGPNPAVKWGPLAPAGDPGRVRVLAADLPCSPCLNLGFEFGCPLRPCMESISVPSVAETARTVLALGAP